MLSASILLALFAAFANEEPPALAAPHFESLAWREVGPTSMGGRIVDLAVDPSRKSTYYVAAASGGLWRTRNNGASFRCVFEDEGSGSVGAVAIAPSRPSTIWVGTGEANPRNSVSWGDGVYRSDDGGESWTHCGLNDSRHVGGIAIHPHDPDTVYVAAMGRTWGPNPERGLFRTQDGGKTWSRILHVDEGTGCIDVRLDPTRPNLVYAAMWTRQRDEFDGGDPAIMWGEGSGLYKSTDGGDQWQRMENGLPTRPLGRCGLDLYQKNPDVLFAIVQTDRTGRGLENSEGGPPRMGVQGEDLDDGYRITRVFDATGADDAGLEQDDVLLAIDEHPTVGLDGLREAMSHYRAGDEVQVRLRRGEEEKELALTFGARPASDSAFNGGMQGGQQANKQGAQGDQGFETGGVFRSDDRGQSWRRINSLNPRPFYYSQIRVDPSDDSRLYVLGISFHWSTDGGASFEGTQRGAHPDHHALWVDPDDGEHLILGNDGGLYVSYDGARSWDHHDHLPLAQFYGIAVDMQQPYHVYGGLQDNGSWGGPTAAPWTSGVIREDWIKIGGGDGFRCAVDPRDPAIVYSESQNGVIQRWNLAENRSSRVRPGGRDRFNWNTPLMLSPHDPSVLYYAGTQLYRSRDGGRSESLSEGLRLVRTSRGTATALAQSALDAEELYVGTDDGHLWTTRNDGGLWARISDNFVGVPGPYWVSGVVASAHRPGTVYACLDGHRNDDDRPYVLRSEDHGYQWTPIVQGLPTGSVRCLQEDPVNPDLIYAGTEFGCFASLDRGAHWFELGSRLPTVPVHDLVVHPREQELVAGTHGRGVWILDVSGLQQLGAESLASAAALMPSRPATTWVRQPNVQQFSRRLRSFSSTNPPSGVMLHYWLREDQDEKVQLQILDSEGRTLNTLEGPGEAGLQRVRWDLGVRRGGRRSGNQGSIGRTAPPGEYVVRWTRGEEVFEQPLEVRPDPRQGAFTSVLD